MIKTLNLHQIYVTVLLIHGENSNKEEETKKINDSRVVLLSIFNDCMNVLSFSSLNGKLNDSYFKSIQTPWARSRV